MTEIVSGDRFGRLTAISHVSTSRSGSKWLFSCDCGAEKEIRVSNVKNGHTSSCGCLHRERSKDANTSHNMSRTKIYKVWASMVSRCSNPDDHAFEHYGARGINVCDQWKASFARFLEDMGQRPTDGHSIERVNNDLGYGPGNCVWIKQERQAQNTRKVRRFSFRGSVMTLRQISEHYGMPLASLNRRLEAGWTIERAVMQPLRPTGSIQVKGEAA